jgi:glycosyltransferase involved in cell wall biosynthesis
MALHGHTILLVSTHRWYHNRYSKQHVASVLSKRNRVLYVEPELAAPVFPRSMRIFRPPEENGDLIVATPRVTPGLSRFDVAHRLRRHDLAHQFRNLVRKHAKGPLVLWIFRPDFVFLHDVFPDRVASVYHCVDRHGALFSDSMRAMVETEEKRLVCEADLTIAVSQQLVQWLRSLGGDPLLVPNGVGEIFFERCDAPGLPDDLPRPRALHVGSFDRTTDIRLLERVVLELRDVSFVFVGPVADDMETFKNRLSALPNVRFLPHRPWNELPVVVRDADVGLLPFTTGEYTLSGCPLKLVEYLAVGMPVVVSGLSPSVELEPLIYRRERSERFTEGVIKALSEHNDDPRRAARIEFARERTWPRQVERIEKHLEERLHGRIG